MKTRTTLILLILVIALGVWIKFFESKQPGTDEARRQSGNVVNFDREKIEGIVIQNGDDRIELHREAGNWRLTAPVKDQADSAAVDNLISDIELWRKDALIPAREATAEKGRLNEYRAGATEAAAAPDRAQDAAGNSFRKGRRAGRKNVRPTGRLEGCPGRLTIRPSRHLKKAG